ncbi:MAG TPA: WcaF family extracellular polysaccharide biosynthesis acetyltransferase [Solirubrobacteraceae bacterium]|jgi:putative colanic acid biosynthesis acetyltransferase WcaF|nr:WcaF family extracellular polysaccharide biosynthesis acetyltransferase [Solirubrobacteraceae bacterium]
MTRVDFSQYSNREGHPEGYVYGRSFLWRVLWHYVSALVFESALVPFYGIKVKLLRWFGATVGEHVEIKPGVRIKYPWKLTLGDHVWLGQDLWIDNINEVRIGSHVLLSQGAHLSCGAHDWSDPGFGGITRPITVEDGAWIAAFVKIALGVTVGEEAIALIGAVVTHDLEPRGIYQGNPAVKISERKIRDYVGPKREEAPAPAAALAG